VSLWAPFAFLCPPPPQNTPEPIGLSTAVAVHLTRPLPNGSAQVVAPPPSRLRGAPVRALMHPPLSGLQPLPPSFALSHMPAPHMGQCCTLLPPSFAHACEGRIPRLGLFLRLFIDGCGIIGAIATPSLLMYTVCIPNHPTLFFDCILSLFPHN